jgi:hypothetical protein
MPDLKISQEALVTVETGDANLEISQAALVTVERESSPLKMSQAILVTVERGLTAGSQASCRITVAV